MQTWPKGTAFRLFPLQGSKYVGTFLQIVVHPADTPATLARFGNTISALLAARAMPLPPIATLAAYYAMSFLLRRLSLTSTE